MRTSRSMDSLFPKTRQAILSAVLLNPDRSWYVRDFARHLKMHVSNLARELPRLVKAGLLKSWKDGSRVYIQANKDNPTFPELRSLIVKTVGLIDVLQEALMPVRKGIDVAFVFGSIASGQETPRSDVDLMLIGTVGLADVAPLLQPLTDTLLREINPVFYDRTEFMQKCRKSGFLKKVLGSEKLFVIGTMNDLEGIVGGKAGS